VLQALIYLNILSGPDHRGLESISSSIVKSIFTESNKTSIYVERFYPVVSFMPCLAVLSTFKYIILDPVDTSSVTLYIIDSYWTASQIKGWLVEHLTRTTKCNLNYICNICKGGVKHELLFNKPALALKVDVLSSLYPDFNSQTLNLTFLHWKLFIVFFCFSLKV